MFLLNHSDHFLLDYLIEELFGLGGIGLIGWWIRHYFKKRAAKKKAMKDRLVELEKENQDLKFENVTLKAENTALKNRN